MVKVEKILELPSITISKEMANTLAEQINKISEELREADYQQILNELAPRLNTTPDEMRNKYGANEQLKNYLVQRKDAVTFLSSHRNYQFAGRDVLYDEIPNDTYQVTVDAPGTAGKYLRITLNNDLTQHFPLKRVNQILIQGTDQNWVDGISEKMKGLILDQRNVFRDVIYKGLRLLCFIGFLAMFYLEFQIYQHFQSEFTLNTPITGLSSVIVFTILLINYSFVFNIGGRWMMKLYPYFEFEDRVSKPRKDFKWLFLTSIVALYGYFLIEVGKTLWRVIS